jgi:uncharacterized iron-regulated membrane protein
MLDVLTVVAFVYAWNAGGWWWAIAIVMGLVWILVWGGKQEQKKKAAAAVNQPDVAPETNSTPTSAPPTGDARSQTEQLSNANDSVNVNLANFDQIISLPGIGAAEAKMIMERRASHPFRSVNDLVHFLDLKPHKADRLENRVIFSAPDRQPDVKTSESPPVIIQVPDHNAPPPAVAKPVPSTGGRMID